MERWSTRNATQSGTVLRVRNSSAGGTPGKTAWLQARRPSAILGFFSGSRGRFQSFDGFTERSPLSDVPMKTRAGETLVPLAELRRILVSGEVTCGGRICVSPKA